ncbi:hypothetical protein AB1399_07560, partial [Hydrogenibacillus schlegelii]|uniref:hypothetical protein n=1 Tax=Hydrogenibacillus schlegelii TaxID=1484 RepID=UPI0034A011ED
MLGELIQKEFGKQEDVLRASRIKSSIMCKLPSSANERTGHSGIHNVQHGRLSGFLLFLLPLP